MEKMAWRTGRTYFEHSYVSIVVSNRTYLFVPVDGGHWIAGGLALQRDGAALAGGHLSVLRHCSQRGRNCGTNLC